MNKDIFKGFINGVVAMYQLGNNLDTHLDLKWNYEYIDNDKIKITCDYCTFICDRLITPGNYENPPEYKEIEERDIITIEVSKHDTVEIAKEINNQILDYISTIHPTYTIN